MTPDTTLKTVEGNIAEIDFDNRFFTLEDKTGIIFIKIFWKPPFEEKIKKQKVGYYEAPSVEMNGENEAVMIDLPWKERGDFPRSQRRQQQKGGGRPWQPRNEKLIVLQCALKAAVDLYIHSVPPGEKYDIGAALSDCTKAAITTTDELMKAGGA